MSGGAYRRTIVLRAEPGRAVADLEDDFHRFTVAIEHDDGVVTGVSSTAIRYPWSSCGLAGSALPALAGLPVTGDATAVYRFADPRAQCTHQFEMAGLAVTHAARGGGARRYEAVVADAVQGESRAELRRDGELVLVWDIKDGVIAAPAEHAGRRPSDFTSRRLAGLPAEEAEALLILRRAVAAAVGRTLVLDDFPNAAAMERGGACFVHSAGRAPTALRMLGSVRNFTSASPPLATTEEPTP